MIRNSRRAHARAIARLIEVVHRGRESRARSGACSANESNSLGVLAVLRESGDRQALCDRGAGAGGPPEFHVNARLQLRGNRAGDPTTRRVSRLAKQEVCDVRDETPFRSRGGIRATTSWLFVSEGVVFGGSARWPLQRQTTRLAAAAETAACGRTPTPSLALPSYRAPRLCLRPAVSELSLSALREGDYGWSTIFPSVWRCSSSW